MNFTWETPILLISVIPCLVASALMLQEYRKSYNRHSLLLFGGFFLLSLCLVVEAIAYLLLEPKLILLVGYMYIVLGILLIIIVDTINNEQLDIRKVTLFAILSTMLVIASFDPVAVIPMTWSSGNASLMKSSYFRYVYLALTSFIGLMLVYYTHKINHAAPMSLKKYSRINFAGGLIMGIAPAIVYGLNLTLILPGMIALFFGIGTLFMSYAFYNRPALGFVLPFRALKLLVVNADSGICLFEYTWDTSIKWNTSLFTGLFHGITSLTQETLQQGKLKEINLENGVMLVENPKNSPIYSILISTRSSRYLRRSLESFTGRFIKRYPEAERRIQNLQTFKTATDLLMDSFPYVPKNE